MSSFWLHEQCICAFCACISRLVLWGFLSLSSFHLPTTTQNKAHKLAIIRKKIKEFQSSSISFSFNHADCLRYDFLPPVHSMKKPEQHTFQHTKEANTAAARKGMPTHTVNSELRGDCSTLVTLIFLCDQDMAYSYHSVSNYAQHSLKQ